MLISVSLIAPLQSTAKTLVLGTYVDAAQEILAFIFQPFLTNEIGQTHSGYILNR